MPGARGLDADFRRVLVIALLPTLAASIGTGAVVPVIPSVAHGLGAGLEVAAFIAGAVVVGGILGDLPAGALVARIGERRSMLLAAAGSIVGIACCALAPSAWLVFAGVLVIGVCSSTFGLARHAYLTLAVPIRYRARTLSTLGGVFRAGSFVGPFIAAGVIGATGSPQAVFWAALAAEAAAILVLLLAPDPESMAPSPGAALAPGAAQASETAGRSSASGSASDASGSRVDGDLRSADALDELEAEEPAGVLAELRRSRGVLLRLGSAAGVVSLLRTARQIVLPVWGLSIGMADADIALVVGLSGTIDFALFFTSGWIMDRWGRAASGVPATFGLAIGFGALALTHDLPDATAWFTALAIWIGFANGIGSGIIMTLGADAAPPARPAPFLAAWHFITDLAAGVVPFLVAGVTALAGLPAVAASLAAIGAVGTGLMARYAPRSRDGGGTRAGDASSTPPQR